MNSESPGFPTVADCNERSLKTLARAVAHSQGQFSLLFARCNYGRLREEMQRRLREQCPIAIREIVLDASATTLLSNIQAEVAGEMPPALMVLGLEKAIALDELLRHSNRVRDQFRDFSFPLVLWVTEIVLQKSILLAPDFKSFATRSIKFELCTEDLLDLLQQKAASAIAFFKETRASNELSNLPITASDRLELESAQRDLQTRGVKLPPALKANLQLILGL